MQNNIYNPVKLVKNYRKLAHGKARADAIRSAIGQADFNHDIPYMVFLREELCKESLWYINGLDVITIFPELLALTDRYPDAALTPFQSGPDHIKPVLWLYEALIVTCSDFYQVPLKECEKFCNDFLQRWTAYGYDAKEPYRMITEFYISIGDMDSAGKFFQKFLQCGGEECYCEPSCAANTEIRYYLWNNEKEKADRIAEDILKYRVKSYNTETNAILRMKGIYMRYYILHGKYTKAAECALVLESCSTATSEFKQYMSFMCAYVYKNPFYALWIYKQYCKEWHNESNLFLKYYTFMNTACFFKGLAGNRRAAAIKPFKQMPAQVLSLAGKDGRYNAKCLAMYYYKEAETLAAKFDKRNGTNKFTNELIMSFENAGN